MAQTKGPIRKFVKRKKINSFDGNGNRCARHEKRGKVILGRTV